MTQSTQTAAKPAVNKAAATGAAKPLRNEKGWQAKKSGMTRLAILEATIQCLLELGYTNTTTALIAKSASVSRGAMMHHFPSRLSVIKAVVDYLHVLRLKEYRDLMSDIDDPNRALTRKVIRKSVEAAWDYVNFPSFLAYQELLAASRTDADLRELVEPVEKDFEEQFLNAVKAIFPHWQNLKDLEAAHDTVQFLMKGMALSHMSVRKKTRAKHVMSHLTDMLYDIYNKASLIKE